MADVSFDLQMTSSLYINNQTSHNITAVHLKSLKL
jgi:hypothetical protein